MVTAELKKSDRVEWIDISKGIGIFLVVLVHTSLPKLISNWIISIIMPFFFFISGYLYQEDKYKIKDFLWVKMKQLMFPYTCFTLIVWFGFYMLNYKMTIISAQELWYGWKGIALWFVPVLFISESIFVYLQKMLSLPLLIISLIICSLIGYFTFKVNFHLPFKIEVVYTAIFFYGGGYLLRYYNKIDLLSNHNIFIYITVLFLTVFSFILSLLTSSHLDMASNTFGVYIPTIIISFSGIAAIIAFSFLLSTKESVIINIIKFFGRNTLIILSFHQLILITLKKYLENLPLNNYLNSGIRHLLLWMILYIFIITINKHFLFLLGKLKK